MTPVALGKKFHADCEVLLPHLPPHPEDDWHNEVVGHVMLDLMNGCDPDAVFVVYNDWAQRHGFEQVRYLGMLTSASPSKVWLAAMSGVILGLGHDGTIYAFQDARTVCQQQ